MSWVPAAIGAAASIFGSSKASSSQNQALAQAKEMQEYALALAKKFWGTSKIPGPLLNAIMNLLQKRYSETPQYMMAREAAEGEALGNIDTLARRLQERGIDPSNAVSKAMAGWNRERSNWARSQGQENYQNLMNVANLVGSLIQGTTSGLMGGSQAPMQLAGAFGSQAGNVYDSIANLVGQYYTLKGTKNKNITGGSGGGTKPASATTYKSSYPYSTEQGERYRRQ